MILFARGRTTPSRDFDGQWINDLGSVLELARNGDAISGRITPRTGTAMGKGVSGKVRGTTRGKSIALVADWGDRAGVAVWIGELDDSDGRETLMLSWELLRYLDDPDRAIDLTMGSARFTRLVAQ